MRAGFVHLGDVCTISGGYTPKPSQLFPEGDIPYFKVADMNRVGNEMSLCYTDQYLKEARKTFPKGAIVFPKNGGAVATNKKRILAHDAVVDLNTGIAIPGEKVDKQYLFYYFQGIDFKCFIKEGTLPVLRTKEIANLPFYFPPLPEQQRIVDVLDQEFAKIDALKANAEKSLQAAKDLFQATLKKELEPKEGWEELAIPEVSENLDSKRVPITKSVRENGQYPYYGASGIVDYVADYIFDEPLLLVSEDGANLLARSTPIAFSIEGKVWVNNHAHVLRFDDYKKQKFVEYWFAGNDISSLITGTAQPKFNQKALNSIKIAFPIKEQEMEGILDWLGEMEGKSNSLQDNYQKTLSLCDDLKQALLRKAFNGEL